MTLTMEVLPVPAEPRNIIAVGSRDAISFMKASMAENWSMVGIKEDCCSMKFLNSVVVMRAKLTFFFISGKLFF